MREWHSSLEAHDAQLGTTAVFTWKKQFNDFYSLDITEWFAFACSVDTGLDKDSIFLYCTWKYTCDDDAYARIYIYIYIYLCILQ